MTKEKLAEIRKALKVLSELTDENWEELLYIAEKTPKDLRTTEKRQKKIIELIHAIGIPANIAGSYYLQSAIKIYLEAKKGKKVQITKEVYPVIAEEFATTPSSVERAIRHALEIAWSNFETEELREKIFGNTINSYKGIPTNSAAILMLAEYLNLY